MNAAIRLTTGLALALTVFLVVSGAAYVTGWPLAEALAATALGLSCLALAVVGAVMVLRAIRRGGWR